MKIFKGLSRAQNRIFLIMTGGMFLEYFDFFLYIHLAPLVVDSYFLPSANNTLTIYLLTIASIVFIRLLGVAIGGYIGDIYGRKPTMIISIVLTGLCCIGFAIVPSYESIGILAVIALMLFRSLQSAASISEISCAITYMTEIITIPYNFFMAALMNAIGFLGVFFALLLASLVMKTYPEGWKILFFISGMLAFISFYFRRKLPESKYYENDIKYFTTGERRAAYFKMVRETLLSKPPFVQLAIEMGSIAFFYLVYIHCSVLLKNTYCLSNTSIIYNNATVAFIECCFSLILAFLTLKYHPLKIIKYRFILGCILIVVAPLCLNNIDSPLGVFAFQCVAIIFSIGILPAQSIIIILYSIYCRVTIRGLVYSVSKLSFTAIGGLILFIGQYSTNNIAWTVIALISACFFYWALQYLIKKHQHNYKTEDYRKAMKEACKWNLEVFHHAQK